MSGSVQIPYKLYSSERWGQLSFYGKKHIFVAESYEVKDENYSFAGQHRIRKIQLKGNVNWLLPNDLLDISKVQSPPRRQQINQR